MTDKRLERIRNKLILWVLGTALSAACASLLPAPASWPLPTGLGGVVGDALLWAPRQMLSGSSLGMAAVGATLIALAILTLTAAAGYHFRPAGEADEAPPISAAASSRAPERYDGDEDDSEGEPGFGLVSLGALIHCTLIAAQRRPTPVRRPAARADQRRPGPARALARPRARRFRRRPRRFRAARRAHRAANDAGAATTAAPRRASPRRPAR